MQTVRTSVTPIGRKFILQGQINNPTISATALSSITVVTQRVPLELFTSAVEMTHDVTNGLDSVCDGRIAARAYAGNVSEDEGGKFAPIAKGWREKGHWRCSPAAAPRCDTPALQLSTT